MPADLSIAGIAFMFYLQISYAIKCSSSVKKVIIPVCGVYSHEFNCTNFNKVPFAY